MTTPTPNPPDVRELPPTPSRANAADGDEFSVLMDNTLATLPLWSGDLEALAQWTYERATDMAQALADAGGVLSTVQQVGDQKIQAAGEQADRARDEADRAKAIAENVASVTNFKGSWSDATGAAEVPSSYFHNYRYWNLLQPLADISAVEPGTDAAVWAPVDVSVANVGDLVYSAKDLTSEGYLPMETAGTYLQASFPSLFGLIGLGTDRFSGAGPTLPLPPLENSVRAIVPSNTGAFMLFGSPHGIDVVETSGWTVVHTISGSFNFNDSTPNQATWSYNDEFLRVQGDGDSVYRTSDWADMANSGAFLANFQQSGHMGFAFSPTERKAIGMDSTDYDKKRLVTFDNSLSVLSETIMTGVPDGFSRGPVFSNDGTKVLIVRNNSYDICEPVAAPTGVITKAGNLGPHGNSWSPDGNYIATSSSIYPLLDGTTGDNIPITGDLGTTLQYTCWEKSSKTVFYAERSSGEPMVIAVDVDSATVATDVNIQNGAAESVALTDNEQFLIVGRLGSLQPMSIAQYIFDPQTEFYIGATSPIPLDAPSNITLKPFIKAEG